MGREPFPLPQAPAPASMENESYYEDPQPYDPININGTSPIGSRNSQQFAHSFRTRLSWFRNDIYKD